MQKAAIAALTGSQECVAEFRAEFIELRDYMPPGFEGIDYETAGQLFISGKAAMLAGGSFDIATYRSQNPALNMDFVAPPTAKAGDSSPGQTPPTRH